MIHLQSDLRTHGTPGWHGVAPFALMLLCAFAFVPHNRQVSMDDHQYTSVVTPIRDLLIAHHQQPPMTIHRHQIRPPSTNEGWLLKPCHICG